MSKSKIGVPVSKEAKERARKNVDALNKFNRENPKPFLKWLRDAEQIKD